MVSKNKLKSKNKSPTFRSKFSSYEEYLNSKDWANYKKMFYRCNLNKCWVCGSDKNLNIHHKTYQRLGKEKKGDCLFLCKTCHCEVHILIDEGLSKLATAHIDYRKYGNLTAEYIQFVRNMKY